MLTSGAFGYIGDYLLWIVLYASLIVHTWCFFRCFPRKGRQRLALVIGNVLVFFCAIGTVALAGESYYRFVAIETDSFGMSLPARRWFALHTRLNALGCRDKEWSTDKPADVRRIAFVGDSFTYGWGIKRTEDRFADRIQAMFDVRSPGRVEVMNVAKAGWDSGAQLRPIQDMIRVYDVDEIVLCYVPNDIEKLLPRNASFDPIRPPEPTIVNLSSSCLVDMLYRRVFLPNVPTVRRYHDWLAEGFADPEIWRSHRQQLSALMQVCTDASATFRVVLLPFIRTGGDRFDARKLHKTMKEFFEAYFVDVVDLLPTIAGQEPRGLVVNGHDAHPNETANELFAGAIWQALYSESAP